MFDQRHVGAIIAHEEEGEAAVVLDRKQDEGGEAVAVDLDAVDDDAFADKLLADEEPHLLVADPGDQGRAETEPGGADRDIGRAAANRLGEGGDILEPGADLLAVEVDGRASDGDDVKGWLRPRFRPRPSPMIIGQRYRR